MIKSILHIVFISLLATACVMKGAPKADKVMVFSAASLTDVMTELVDSFEVKYPEKVILNLASSGTLARQMEQGSLPGVFISASSQWSDYVLGLGLVDTTNQKSIARNQLVLIATLSNKTSSVKLDSTLDLLMLLGVARLSIGDAKHVPAGKYAKQALEYYGCYESIANQLLPAKDVRSALMVVELGETPLGIVYITDAKKSKKVKVLDAFGPQSHDAINYVASLCEESEGASLFYQFIASPEVDVIWTKYGFTR